MWVVSLSKVTTPPSTSGANTLTTPQPSRAMRQPDLEFGSRKLAFGIFHQINHYSILNEDMGVFFRKISSAWLEEFQLSKNNLEIMAAFVAVKIASNFLGFLFLFLFCGPKL
jgi:hypothetical protein